MKRALIISVLLLSAFQLFGATWYVATNGNNAADGSLSTPWLTWRYGLVNMSGGDTLNIRGGVYPNEIFMVEEFKSGTDASHPTIVQTYSVDAAQTNLAILKPRQTNSLGETIFNGIQISNGKSNIVLNSFSLDGTNMTSTGIKLTGGATNITITNVNVYGVPTGMGILASGDNEGDFMGSLITHCNLITNGWGGPLDTEGGHPDLHQIYIQTSGMTVENCYVVGGTNTHGNTLGIHYFGGDCTNGVFRNNTFTNCGTGILAGASRGSNCWIYNNVFFGCEGTINVSQMLWVYVQNNTGHTNSAGIYAYRSTNVWIENNISEGSPINSTAGVYLESCSNVFVSHNLCATNRVDFTIYKTLSLSTNNNLFQKVRYVDNLGEGETFTNGTTYATKFVNASAGNLRVLPGSDAIRRGKTESEFTTDAGGRPRGGTNWTIGAWQFAPPSRISVARFGTGTVVGP